MFFVSFSMTRKAQQLYLEGLFTEIDMIKRDFQDCVFNSIFIGGGNTYKLLKGLKESGAFSKIQDYIQNDGIVVGCSAGAVICGKDIDIITSMDPNDVNLTDTEGFDVLSGISIFPHYINLKSKLSEEENKIVVEKYTNSIIEFTLKKVKFMQFLKKIRFLLINKFCNNNEEIYILGNKPFYYFKEGKKIEYSISEKEGNINELYN